MNPDYLPVKQAWDAGELHALADILTFVKDMAIFANDMGIALPTLKKRLTHPELLTFQNYISLSSLTGIPQKAPLDLVVSNIKRY